MIPGWTAHLARGWTIQLTRERHVLVAWALGLLLYFLIIGWSYATVKDHAAGIDLLWNELPESLRKAIGDAPSITTPGGYFESRATSLLPLVLGGAVAAQATRRLAGAEQAGELDHVLSLPVRRSTYFWAHWAAGATHLLGWLAAAAVGAMAGMAAAGMGTGVLLRIGYMVAEVLPFCLAVQAGALLAGACFHRRPPASAILASTLAALFLLQILSSLSPTFAWLRWFSPYALWMLGEPYSYDTSGWYLLSTGLVVAVCLPLAVRIWLRKDLKG